MRVILACQLLLASATLLSGQSYVEDFTGEDGQGHEAACGVDGGSPATVDVTTCPGDLSAVQWTLDGSAALGGQDHARVENGILEYQDVDGEVCWQSPLLDISGVTGNFDVSVDVATVATSYEAADYLDVWYTIDGGTPQPVPNWMGMGDASHTIIGTGIGPSGSTTVAVTGLTGSSTLTVRVCALVNANNEVWQIDNISAVPQGGSIILPIELISFSAVVHGAVVQVAWETASEEANEAMIIEKSTDGQVFHEVGRVRGKRYASERQSYRWQDHQPSPGVNYYRLRQIDVDGREMVHEMTSVFVSFEPDITFDPNPVEDVGRLHLGKVTTVPLRVQLQDFSGRLCRAWDIPGGASTWDLEWDDLLPGFYTLQIQSDTHVLNSIKVVKQ